MSDALPDSPSDSLGDDLGSSRFSTTGFRFKMGAMDAISTVLSVVEIIGLHTDEVMKRRDYELEGVEPGNRLVSLAHVKKIKEGLRRHANKLLLGTFILAIDPQGVKVETVRGTMGDSIDIIKFTIKYGHPLSILDAQHRSAAIRQLWQDTMDAVQEGDVEAEEVARLLQRSAIPVLIVLENSRDEISRMFVSLASTRPISASLVSVMDIESFANRLGLAVAKSAKLLAAANRADRLEFQGSLATEDKLYAAAAVRGAVANMFIGYRDRSPDMREQNLRRLFGIPEGSDHESAAAEEAAAIADATAEAVDLLDHAYSKLPGWRDLKAKKIDAKDFRSAFVHGTPAGLYVIAGVICAARMCPGIDPKHVIDLMADTIHWRRDARVADSEDSRPRHPEFEGTLVITEPVVDDQNEIVGWKTRTGGGARTNYEKAARVVIDHLIEADPTLAEMRSDRVQIEMGLKAGGKRGRPPKKVK